MNSETNEDKELGQGGTQENLTRKVPAELWQKDIRENKGNDTVVSIIGNKEMEESGRFGDNRAGTE